MNIFQSALLIVRNRQLLLATMVIVRGIELITDISPKKSPLLVLKRTSLGAREIFSHWLFFPSPPDILFFQ